VTTTHSARLLDQLGYGDTAIHRLDPRAKTLATAIFVITVVSYPKYAVASLVPLVLYPLVFIVVGEIPPGVILKRTAAVSPFAVLVGIFNPLLDTQPRAELAGFAISGGWISFLSILLRFGLTVTAALALVATTSFPRICQGLDALRLPRAFIVQMLFLYRYLFVLIEEAVRMKRARDLRRFGTRLGLRPRVAASLISVLFLRTYERAERVYLAMCARGFDGHLRMAQRLRWRWPDAAFVGGTMGTCLILRFVPVVHLLGQWGEGWL
jgi:cobalt/nickel transport system permease protein